MDTKQVSYDYCFMRDKPGMESAKILVSKDRATRMVFAHVVPLKGAVIDWVIQQCARDLERLGYYGQVTLKSDLEAAIVDVLREIANLRGSRGTLLEHSPEADSQSNGLLERGIMMSLCLEVLVNQSSLYLLSLGSSVTFKWKAKSCSDSEGNSCRLHHGVRTSIFIVRVLVWQRNG